MLDTLKELPHHTLEVEEVIRAMLVVAHLTTLKKEDHLTEMPLMEVPQAITPDRGEQSPPG